MIKQLANEFVEHSEFAGGPSEWVNKTMAECLGDRGLTGFTHRFMLEAAVALVESEGDFSKAIKTIEADIYTDDLMKWLGSDYASSELVNDVVNTKTYSSQMFNIMDCVMLAQGIEKKRIFEILYGCLRTEQKQREMAS